jgi:hypothetical protein
MASQGRNVPASIASPGSAAQESPEGAVSMGDPALERPKLITDSCKNVDLPFGAYSINNQVSSFWRVMRPVALSFDVLV